MGTYNFNRNDYFKKLNEAAIESGAAAVTVTVDLERIEVHFKVTDFHKLSEDERKVLREVGCGWYQKGRLYHTTKCREALKMVLREEKEGVWKGMKVAKPTKSEVTALLKKADERDAAKAKDEAKPTTAAPKKNKNSKKNEPAQAVVSEVPDMQQLMQVAAQVAATTAAEVMKPYLGALAQLMASAKGSAAAETKEVK